MFVWVLNMPLGVLNTLDTASDQVIVFEINLRVTRVKFTFFLVDFYRIKFLSMQSAWGGETL